MNIEKYLDTIEDIDCPTYIKKMSRVNKSSISLTGGMKYIEVFSGLFPLSINFHKPISKILKEEVNIDTEDLFI